MPMPEELNEAEHSMTEIARNASRATLSKSILKAICVLSRVGVSDFNYIARNCMKFFNKRDLQVVEQDIWVSILSLEEDALVTVHRSILIDSEGSPIPPRRPVQSTIIPTQRGRKRGAIKDNAVAGCDPVSQFPPCPPAHYGAASRHEELWRKACELTSTARGWFGRKDLRSDKHGLKDDSHSKRWLKYLIKSSHLEKRGKGVNTEYRVRK